MRIKVRRKTHPKRVSRLKKKLRIRKTVFGTEERPRLCVYRSLHYISVQAIDDTAGKTLLAATTKELNVKSKGNKEAATTLAKAFAEKAKAAKLQKFVFDRSGYLYHGKIKAFAEAAREAGLSF